MLFLNSLLRLRLLLLFGPASCQELKSQSGRRRRRRSRGTSSSYFFSAHTDTPTTTTTTTTSLSFRTLPSLACLHALSFFLSFFLALFHGPVGRNPIGRVSKVSKAGEENKKKALLLLLDLTLGACCPYLASTDIHRSYRDYINDQFCTILRKRIDRHAHCSQSGHSYSLPHSRRRRIQCLVCFCAS